MKPRKTGIPAVNLVLKMRGLGSNHLISWALWLGVNVCNMVFGWWIILAFVDLGSVFLYWQVQCTKLTKSAQSLTIEASQQTMSNMDFADFPYFFHDFPQQKVVESFGERTSGDIFTTWGDGMGSPSLRSENLMHRPSGKCQWLVSPTKRYQQTTNDRYFVTILVGCDWSICLIFGEGVDLRVPKHDGRLFKVTNLWVRCKYWPAACRSNLAKSQLHDAQHLKQIRFFCEDMFGYVVRGFWSIFSGIFSHFVRLRSGGVDWDDARLIGNVKRPFASGQGSELRTIL